MVSLQIGEAHHPPVGEPLYPVYRRTEYGTTGPVYVTLDEKRNLMMEIDRIYAKAEIMAKKNRR